MRHSHYSSNSGSYSFLFNSSNTFTIFYANSINRINTYSSAYCVYSFSFNSSYTFTVFYTYSITYMSTPTNPL
jgi:hypothetical protein